MEPLEPSKSPPMKAPFAPGEADDADLQRAKGPSPQTQRVGHFQWCLDRTREAAGEVILMSATLQAEIFCLGPQVETLN